MSFKSVTKNCRCVICGYDSWCSYTEDESYVICRRENQSGAKVKYDSKGNEYYVYKIKQESK